MAIFLSGNVLGTRKTGIRMLPRTTRHSSVKGIAKPKNEQSYSMRGVVVCPITLFREHYI